MGSDSNYSAAQMLFLSKFVIWLLSPLAMAFCLAGLALALAWRRRLRSSMALAALAFVWLWAWSMPMISHWIGNSIEQQYLQKPIAAVAEAPVTCPSVRLTAPCIK